jgi:hypothetical protein
MPTTRQTRQHADRNVVPDDVQSDCETETGECPVDPGNLAHMHADRSVLD